MWSNNLDRIQKILHSIINHHQTKWWSLHIFRQKRIPFEWCCQQNPLDMKVLTQNSQFTNSRKIGSKLMMWGFRFFGLFHVNLKYGVCVTVWKNEKFTLTEKIFRQINYLVILLVKTLFSRNFCQKSVRVNFCKFHSVCASDFPTILRLKWVNFVTNFLFWGKIWPDW